MKTALFVVTNPDTEVALNLILAVRALAADGALAPTFYLANQTDDLRHALVAQGLAPHGDELVRFAPSVPALAEALKDLRRDGHRYDHILFNELSDLLFFSFLSLYKDTPHVVYDVHILGGMTSFFAQSGLTPRRLKAFLAGKGPLLRVYNLFPGFNYLYVNYGFPATTLRPTRYAVYLPLYRGPWVAREYVYSAGNHQRDYRLLHDSMHGVPARLRIRTNDADGIADLAAAGRVEVYGRTDYLPFLQETAEAAFVVMPLVVTEHTSCGLSFLAHAMALGKAIITTRCPSTEGYIEDGVTGLLVPPADQTALRDRIRQLLGDPALRRQLEVNVSRHVREQMDLVARLGLMLDLSPRPQVPG